MAKKSDGEIVISTKLDNSELDKDLEKLDKKIEKKGKKKKKIPIEVEVTENANNDNVIENVEKKIKKKATTSKKKTSGTKQKIAKPQFDPEDISEMTITFGGQTFDQKGADEYLKKVEQINEETKKSNEQKIEVPEKTIKQAKEVKKEIQEVKQNIENLPTTKIEEVAQKEKQVAEQVKEVNKNLQEVKKDDYIQLPVNLKMDKFDKQIVNLENKIRNEEDKAQLKLKAKLQAEDELKRHKQAIFEIEQEYEKTSQQVEHLQNIMSKQAKGISLTPQEFTDLENYAEINKQNEKLGSTLDKAYEKQTKLNNKVEQTSLAYKQIQDNVQGYKTKIESIKLQKQQAQVSQLKEGFQKVNTSVSSSIKHIGRLALGIFSVASAYSIVSQASSTLGQYDEQYATNLEYIRYLIAQAIAPALKYVVNLASTLLSYLNYILNAWFGITLFSKNSAKNFMNAKNSTGGMSKNTGKIKKDLQTTPFDEMNILTDTSDSGTSGAAGGGAVAPSIDPSLFEGEVPDWLQWLVEHKDEILAVMAGVASGLLAWQLGLSAIKALGIGLLIAGIVYTIESLLAYLQDPSWENFGKIIQGIGVTIVGLGLLIGSVPAVVAGAIVLIVGTIVKYWEQIKSFLQNGIDWLISKTDWVKDNFGIVGETIYTIFTSLLQGLLNIFDSLFTAIKGIFDGIIKFITGVFSGNWKQAWEGIKDIFSSVWNGIKGIVSSVWQFIKSIFNSLVNLVKGIVNTIWGTIKGLINLITSGINVLIRGINKLSFDAPDWVPGIGGKKFGFNIPEIPRLAKGTILNAPGRGVPVAGGTALAGEAGREAYLPLSDTQLLEELGSTIGKYITINANITNTMNGRVISRQLQKIQNDSNFAYNS